MKKKNWIKRHLKDEYVKKAKNLGYRSRAAFKLLEINDKFNIIKPNLNIVELGSSPGSWTQVINQLTNNEAKQIICCDLLGMDPVDGTTFIQGDFTKIEIEQEILAKCSNKIDLVISDMSPNISGVSIVDQMKMTYLLELVIEFTLKNLNKAGWMIIKMFQGKEVDNLIKLCKNSFQFVRIIKPKASRSGSKEFYLLAKDKK